MKNQNRKKNVHHIWVKSFKTQSRTHDLKRDLRFLAIYILYIIKCDLYKAATNIMRTSTYISKPYQNINKTIIFGIGNNINLLTLVQKYDLLQIKC